MPEKTQKSNRNSRNRKIQIRLNDNEKQQILANAKGMDISTFLRTLGLGQEANAPPLVAKNVIHSADPELVREVAKIGNNINQIARHLNLTKEMDRTIFIEILKVKDDLDAELDRLKKSKADTDAT